MAKSATQSYVPFSCKDFIVFICVLNCSAVIIRLSCYDTSYQLNIYIYTLPSSADEKGGKWQITATQISQIWLQFKCFHATELTGLGC